MRADTWHEPRLPIDLPPAVVTGTESTVALPCPHDDCGRVFGDYADLGWHLINHRRDRRRKQHRADDARAEAIAAAAAGADPAALEVLRLVVLSVAKRGPFTADDVWDYLTHTGQTGPTNPAALGPVIQQLARTGQIVRTGRHVRTRIARRHRDLVEWQAAA